MFVTLTIGFICLIFAFLAKYKETKYGLEIAFFIIFLFLGLRYDFGSDYNAYLVGFDEVNATPLNRFFDPELHFEPGWIILNRIFSPFGFFSMIIALALFNCYVYYNFISKYVPYRYYWLAVFIYFFSPGLMLVHASAMRQALSIAIFVLSLDYLYRKRAIAFYTCVIVAILFHTSAIILLPIYIFRILNWKANLAIAIAIVFGLLILIPFGGFLPIFMGFVLTHFERYEFYQESAELGSGFGFVIMLFFVSLIVYFIPSQIKRNAQLFRVSLFGYIFIPLSLLIAMLARLSMYFEPFLIAVYPLICFYIKNAIIRYIFIAIIVVYTIFLLLPYFKPWIWNFEEYHTIFSAPKWY